MQTSFMKPGYISICRAIGTHADQWTTLTDNS